MAQQAESQHTRIEWWTLDDLLEYLTLAPFRYEIDAALRRMERAISTGDLPLIVDNYFDGKVQSYEIDPFRFHTGYALEFDYFSQVVRIAPLGGHQFGEKRGRVNKQHALRVWPLRPPASQAPRQLEGKADPDPVEAEAGAEHEEPKTQSARLIGIMEKMRLKRSELLLHEVREKVRPHFKKKYPDCDQPADITFDRAYRKYQSAE